jgi:hypothetical protein
VEDAADFDLQDFLDAESVSASSSGKSEVVAEGDLVFEAIAEDELEAPDERQLEFR